MIEEYKIIDDGIWVPYHELQRGYNEKIEYLKMNQNHISISSKTVGQLDVLSELKVKYESNKNK